MIKILLAVLLFLPGKVCADGINELSDRAIAATVKTLAKVFVETVDLEKFKAKHIRSLSKMTEEKFQKRYIEIYDVVKDIPAELRVKYGVTEHLNRTEAVKNIGHLDKTDLAEIIDGIPDQVVIKYVKIYIKKNVDQAKDQIFLQQIDSLWKKITQKA
ncbi:MAG: hypothetical protein HYZ86_03590 [Candidatus Omnitrophica bacterium]|nr:hypothetical protein [Candidatus Omnitrophota bacterium]